MTLIQRFGSALNLNIHFHILFLDGVYVYRDNRPPRFQRVKAPDKSELEDLVQLMYGCICCTIREDLVLELRNLYLLRTLGDVPRFNRVLIETTGLAGPVPIIHTFMANSELRKVYRMQSVITLVDAVAGERTLNDQNVSLRQVALADQLLISKVDIAEPEERDNLRRKLADINPAASIIDVADFTVDSLSSANHYPLRSNKIDIEPWLGDEDSSGHGSGIQTFILNWEPTMALADLVLFFQELVNYQPEKLLRVKGLVAVEGKTATPAVVHCIRDKVYPLVWLESWPQNIEPETQLVFITDAIHRAEIEQTLETVCRV